MIFIINKFIYNLNISFIWDFLNKLCEVFGGTPALDKS